MGKNNSGRISREREAMTASAEAFFEKVKKRAEVKTTIVETRRAPASSGTTNQGRCTVTWAGDPYYGGGGTEVCHGEKSNEGCLLLSIRRMVAAGEKTIEGRRISESNMTACPRVLRKIIEE